MEYLLGVITLVAIYAIAAVGLNLAFGLGGLFVVTQGAFLGIGAYATGVLAKAVPLGFWPGLVLAALVAAPIAWIIGYLTIRIRGDAFIVASMGLQIVMLDIFFNIEPVTGGAFGLSGIPEVMPNRFLYALLVVLVLGLVVIYAGRISRSAIGRVLRAIRDEEMAAWMSGKDVVKIKVQVYVLTCVLAAIAGGFLAAFSRYVHPTNFTIHESILLISMIIAGGLGSIHGAVLGAILVVGLPEILRFAPLAADYIVEVQRIIYGLALVLIPYFKPRGLFPDNYTLRDQSVDQSNTPLDVPLERGSA